MGRAPYKLVGYASLPSTSLAEANVEAYNNAMRMAVASGAKGVCDYCGALLTNHFIIKDADGKRFCVGCDCVMKIKSEDSMLADEVHREKLRIERVARAEKKDRERLERREATLAKQRERNGGLTDLELHQKAVEEKRLAGLKKGLQWAEYAAKLEMVGGNFAESVAAGLRAGELPRGRGMDIMLDILSKLAGRRGSKAFDAEMERLQEIFK